jgi:His Kinase A (phospho-acceptor) domain
MNLPPRLRLYLGLAGAIFLLHVGVALLAKPSFALTIIGDVIPCALLIVAILSFADNFRQGNGLLPLFWKLSAAGLSMMLLSQAYWIYYDSARRHGEPSPVPGDSFFLLAHVFFLFALALRPHSISAGRDLRIRRLDFALLTLWWFALYGYFSLPWQFVLVDYAKYNPAYYFLSFVQHLVLILALTILLARHKGSWRLFYAQLLIAFVLIAGGNLLLSVSIDKGLYYSGGFFDTPFLLSLVWFTIAGCYGSSLEPAEEIRPNRELKQSVWTARVAMLAILSLPLIALLGDYEYNVPPAVFSFRLRLVFGAMFFLGALAFWKLNLLARELMQLVNLTQASIENLKAVQGRITQSQKLAALGRLAAGATHEISNPLTAILGYSELLADIPSLSGEDRENAQVIQQQVHHAQSAVNSLRNSLRNPIAPHPLSVEKIP